VHSKRNPLIIWSTFFDSLSGRFSLDKTFVLFWGAYLSTFNRVLNLLIAFLPL